MQRTAMMYKAKEGQKGENPSQQSESAGENANDQMDANLADRQKKMEAMPGIMA